MDTSSRRWAAPPSPAKGLRPHRPHHSRTHRTASAPSAGTTPPMALFLPLMISIAMLSSWPSTVHAQQQQMAMGSSSSSSTVTAVQTAATAVGASGKQQQDFQRIWLNGQSIKMPVPSGSVAMVSESISPRIGCNLGLKIDSMIFLFSLLTQPKRVFHVPTATLS